MPHPVYFLEHISFACIFSVKKSCIGVRSVLRIAHNLFIVVVRILED
jgi:hypothetical protein